MNNEQNIFVIQNLSDSSDFVFYKIYETQNKLFNWKYKSRNEITKEVFRDKIHPSALKLLDAYTLIATTCWLVEFKGTAVAT